LAAATKTSYRTDVFAGYGAQADAEIQKIVAQNEAPAQSGIAKVAQKHASAHETKRKPT
jgi:membrane fusion protein (multidrug efflux system)